MTIAGDILILGYGNPARGDDGLGPAVANAMAELGVPNVTTIWDYQPQVEHASDVAASEAVVFVDASRTGSVPYSFRSLAARALGSFSTHLLHPESVLDIARLALGWNGRAYLLAVRGYRFDVFEESLTPKALANLGEALESLAARVRDGRLDALADDAPADPPCGDAADLVADPPRSDPDYRLAVRQLLEAGGYEVTEAIDGESGLRAFLDRGPRLVIVDLMMEEVDSGVNLVRQIRATGSTVPVVLTSSVGDSLEAETNASKLGFSGVIQKPFSKEHLLAVVRMFVQ
jgi:hydrogenase maturation protease